MAIRKHNRSRSVVVPLALIFEDSKIRFDEEKVFRSD